jgi:hypothetical protein
MIEICNFGVIYDNIRDEFVVISQRSKNGIENIPFNTIQEKQDGDIFFPFDDYDEASKFVDLLNLRLKYPKTIEERS